MVMLNVKHETDDLERVIRKALKAKKSLEERKHYTGDYYERDRRPGDYHTAGVRPAGRTGRSNR